MRASSPCAEEALQQRGRAGAVDVVVAEYGDGLATLDGVGEAGSAFVHVAQGAGIRHQRLDGGVEGDRHLVRCDVTGREHAAQQLRQLVALAIAMAVLAAAGPSRSRQVKPRTDARTPR